MQIDAFPGDIVIFARVINLLRGIIYESYYFTSLYQRICSIIVLYFLVLIYFVVCLGLSSTMNVRIVYLDIMRPFAESVLLG